MPCPNEKVRISLFNYPEALLEKLRSSPEYQQLETAVKSEGFGLSTLFVDGNDHLGRAGNSALRVTLYMDGDEAEELMDAWTSFVTWLSRFQSAAPVFINHMCDGYINHYVSRRGMSKSIEEVYALLNEDDAEMLALLSGITPEGRIMNTKNLFASASSTKIFENLLKV